MTPSKPVLSVTDNNFKPVYQADAKKWYLIYSKPKSERIAEQNLNKQGFVTYLPYMSASKKRNGRLVTISEPMFPRYLFIGLDTETDNWLPIRSTIGVSMLIRFGDKPAVVPDALVRSFMHRTADNGILTSLRPNYKSGDPVRIFDGAFKDYEAIFLSKSGSERVLLLLDMIGRRTRVSVEAQNVTKA